MKKKFESEVIAVVNIEKKRRRNKSDVQNIVIKTCASCLLEKSLNDFHVSKERLDGRNPYCKECIKEKFDKRDPNIIKEYRKEWYKKNRKLTLKRVKNRAKYNREEVREYKRKWAKNNSHSMEWRALLTSCLRRMGEKKIGRTIDLLGYSAEQLQHHIEKLWSPGMSWENRKEWHIDHIRPLSSFGRNELPSIVNALSNLQPLWATTRIIDGVEYIGNLNKLAKWEPNDL